MPVALLDDPRASGLAEPGALLRVVEQLVEALFALRDMESDSIPAGLDYAGVGPEHAWLHDIGRAEYVGITDAEALEAFQLLCRTEGIIPALEPSHALAHVAKIAPALPREHLIVLNLSGRGDKDINTVAQHLGVEL